MILTLSEQEPLIFGDSTSRRTFIEKFTDEPSPWSATQGVKQTKFSVSCDLTGDAFHRNYLEYLSFCWKWHQSAIVSPEILWYGLLCEVAGIVKEDPETYRDLFTESEEKETVSVPGQVILPLDLLMSELTRKVPTDTKLFFPKFTTNTDKSSTAWFAAFADMVSPYYDYMVFACGIPRVMIRGTVEDYSALSHAWYDVGQLITGHDEYFAKVQIVIDTLHDHVSALEMFQQPFQAEIDACVSATAYMKDMFLMEKCGSGSETVVSGWITDLFRIQPQLRKAHNFSSHISEIKYTQAETGQKYEMSHGLFCSSLEDGFLVPDFGSIIIENKS